MIEFNNVTLHYHYENYPLFEGLSFTLHRGVNTVLCDTQSGKTSLCRLILGDILPNVGQITVEGTSVGTKKSPPPSVLYLPKTPTFFPNKTVLFNLQYPSKIRKILPQNSQKILQIARDFQLENLLKTKVKKLSAEQQKTLCIARGLTVQRDIVLFDDFFDDTDIWNFQNIQKLFSCKTQVVVTDNPKQAVGHTVVLDGGKCIFQGDAAQAGQVVLQLGWLSQQIRS